MGKIEDIKKTFRNQLTFTKELNATITNCETIDNKKSPPNLETPSSVLLSSIAKCPICKKEFRGKVASYKLRRHLANEHGECPEECPLCNKLFTNTSMLNNVRTHIKNVHKEDPDKFNLKTEVTDTDVPKPNKELNTTSTTNTKTAAFEKASDNTLEWGRPKNFLSSNSGRDDSINKAKKPKIAVLEVIPTNANPIKELKATTPVVKPSGTGNAPLERKSEIDDFMNTYARATTYAFKDLESPGLSNVPHPLSPKTFMSCGYCGENIEMNISKKHFQWCLEASKKINGVECLVCKIQYSLHLDLVNHVKLQHLDSLESPLIRVSNRSETSAQKKVQGKSEKQIRLKQNLKVRQDLTKINVKETIFTYLSPYPLFQHQPVHYCHHNLLAPPPLPSRHLLALAALHHQLNPNNWYYLF